MRIVGSTQLNYVFNNSLL